MDNLIADGKSLPFIIVMEEWQTWRRSLYEFAPPTLQKVKVSGSDVNDEIVAVALRM